MVKLLIAPRLTRDFATRIETFEGFKANCPQRIQEIWEWELRHVWGIAKANTQIALHIEERRPELEAVLAGLDATLEEKGLTFDDLIALRRVIKDGPMFRMQAEYTLPPAYRDAERETDEVTMDESADTIKDGEA